MNVGIYKPHKKVYFYNTTEDHAAWSSEVTKLAKIYADRFHDVYMLSENDLSSTENSFHEHIHDEKYDSHKKLGDMDILFVFCGAFYESESTRRELLTYKQQAKQTVLIVTDMSLLPRRDDALTMFDVVITQSTRFIPQLALSYQEFADLTSITGFGADVVTQTPEKTIDFVFGGSERRRLNDFLEYVWRPGHVVYTRSPFLGINTKVSRDKYLEDMSKAFATICIADTTYNEHGFVTHRPVECAITNTLAFADKKYDPDCLLIPEDHYLRVENYKELRTKMNELKNDPDKYQAILKWQREQFLSQDVIDGWKIYTQLTSILD